MSECYKEIYDDAIKRSCDKAGYTIDIKKERKIKIFNPDVEKNTCFYSQFHPKILIGALISYTKDKALEVKVSPNSYKVTMTIYTENGNQFKFVCQILKVLSKQWIADNKEKLQDGNESSDSDDLYEDPIKQKENQDEENGEQVIKN